jgi:hypothetical protein
VDEVEAMHDDGVCAQLTAAIKRQQL